MTDLLNVLPGIELRQKKFPIILASDTMSVRQMSDCLLLLAGTNLNETMTSIACGRISKVGLRWSCLWRRHGKN